ncbi:MAG: class I SAM-dependent methyltransferase [Acidobacteria bacterium]|nr:class I SAM-dependent methyltransferase [Acidobacteriota bacterium]
MYKFLSLGSTPLANRFVTPRQLRHPEPAYPLDVCFCEMCGLVQLADVVPPEILFTDYIYVSGTSETMRKHFSLLARTVARTCRLSTNSLVVDIGSNDGTLLAQFAPYKVRTLGFEPAANIARIARDNGIDTVNGFFSPALAEEIAEDRGRAQVILATNVFAHVDRIDLFLRAVRALLAEDGFFVVEVPYLADLLRKKEFDTIYHEHLSYFSLRPLMTLFAGCGMHVAEVDRVPVHGGSLRVFVRNSPQTAGPVSASVRRLLRGEKMLKLDRLSPYRSFAQSVESLAGKLVRLLDRLKGRGKRIAGYGAPAKSTTLLNYCRIGADLIDYIVDKSSHKQGLYTPGTHIPVLPVETLMTDPPDYLLILAWNFQDEIMKQQRRYKEEGGRFILPIPEPKLV